MTYSYATKAWVLEHMKLYIFGRDILAHISNVNPKTISSWYRNEILHDKRRHIQCNEYERAMAIALYRKLPKRINVIADTFNIDKDTVRQFNSDVGKSTYTDLYLRTSDALIITEPAVERGLNNHGEDRYLTDKFLWPNPFEIYYLTWLGLDYKFVNFLKTENALRLGLFHPEFDKNLNRGGYKLSWKASRNRSSSTVPSIRVVGPHRYRGAKLKNNELTFDSYTEQMRVTGRFVGSKIGYWMHECEITPNLLCGYIPKEYD